MLPHTVDEVKKYHASELTTSQIISLIDQVADSGIKRMAILGGEPQMRSDFNKIISYATQKIPLVSLTTNGIGTRKHLETLIKIPAIDISLDTNDLHIGSLTRPRQQVKAALNTLELLYKIHPFLCVNIVVTPSVINGLWVYVDWLFTQKHIKKVNLYPLLTENSLQLTISEKQAEKLIEDVKTKYQIYTENYCKSGKHVVVDYNGKIIPCAAFFGSDCLIGTSDQLQVAINHPVMKHFSKYDFKSVAPQGGDTFASSNCPGKMLYDNQWKNPKVRLINQRKKTTTSYCLRCNQISATTNICSFCQFTHFDNHPLTMACGCFSLLNPEFFSKK